MEQSSAEFFHDFRQELLAGAEANSQFQLVEFMDAVTGELTETGFIEGYEFCHFRAARGMRSDGYWLDDEGVLSLFVADFESRQTLESLTKTDVDAFFRRVVSFFRTCFEKELYRELEETSPEYGLARLIHDRRAQIRKLNFFLVSERTLSDRIKSIEDDEVSGINASYYIWDISRLNRQRSSRGHKEPLEIDFCHLFGKGVACLPAHLGAGSYQSYLVVMPATVLATLYEKYGARLLEQNVRCFLQARGNVNKGIRSTILNEPEMFFAYNNGITATAEGVEVRQTSEGLEIERIRDLQVVNGGQTTASLFHTSRRDKASLEGIFVQMKLSIVSDELSESVVPKISEYANTQNRVNAADFFSNHPFHVRMEGFSRRLWAPAYGGSLRESRWFYERARGQYADAQSDLTPGEKRKFLAENPKSQMFTKTDLAKFDNVWDDHPRWVNLGAQKNFARYAERIGKEWEKNSDRFNERYFRQCIARGILFRYTEKMVSAQPWYNGGYRANIVAYTLALVAELARSRGEVFDFMKVWDRQSPTSAMEAGMRLVAGFVNEDIIDPPSGISNISEWCKKEACWARIKGRVSEFEKQLPEEFFAEFLPEDEARQEVVGAKKTQKVDNGIEAQKRVFEISGDDWGRILQKGEERRLFSPKELGVLKIAAQIPKKVPTDKQCVVLIDVLEKMSENGLM